MAKHPESMPSALQVKHGSPSVSGQSDASPPVGRMRTLMLNAVFPMLTVQTHWQRGSSTCACGKLGVRAIATNRSRASKSSSLCMVLWPSSHFQTSSVRWTASVVSTSLTPVRGEVDSPQHRFSMRSKRTALADTRPQVRAPSVKRPGPIAARLGLESRRPHYFWYGC
jgi:hypothetical protein